MLGWGIWIFIALTVAMLIVRKFFKTAFRIVSIIWFVVFLACLGFGILIYADIKEMQESCPEMPALLLLEDKGKILAGMEMAFGSENQTQEAEDLFLKSLSKYQTAYENNDFSGILEKDHCTIVFFNISLFEAPEKIS